MPTNGIETNTAQKQTVAVLGAGPAGLAAALALAETGRYDVHVYQMGWRAGGKCATGREPGHHRALQNGSHYLFGSYHNAFALIRRAHEVIDGSSEPDKHLFGSFDDDFVARNLLVGKQTYLRGTVPRGAETAQAWYRYMPQNMAMPGEGGKFPTPFDFCLTMAQFAAGTVIDFAYAFIFFRSDSDRFEGVRLCVKLLPLSPFEPGPYARVVRTALRPVRWLFNATVGGVTWASHGGVTLAEVCVPAGVLRTASGAWSRLWKKLVAMTRAGLRKFVQFWLKQESAVSRRAQRLFILFDLALTILVGYFEDELNRPGGFESIDDEDFREWLERHYPEPADDQGRELRKQTIHSALVTTWYDAVIAYEDGNKKKPRCSAAVAVHAILRSCIGYKGAFAFQMRAEVGDSYIAPIVKALEILGVKFHFYSRVKQIVIDKDESAVSKVVLGVQCAHPPVQAEFIEVPDTKPGKPPRKAWPSVPKSAPASDPPLDSYYSTHEVGERTLHRRSATAGPPHAEAFDWVIAAVPIGVMQDVLVREGGRPIAAEAGPWRDCFDHVKVTESQSLRMWFKVPLGAPNGPSLGWRHDPPILSGYEWPHSTWEDNSQAAWIHSFPKEQIPQTIATLFGPLQSHGRDARHAEHPRRQLALAHDAAEAFVASKMLDLWPGLSQPEAPEGVDWDAFIDLSGRSGPERFRWQYVAANVGPIESYVLALPNTLVHRLRPDESGFRNLYLAGDWTRNGVEVGTVEGAVMSGLKAARSISGAPTYIVGADDLERGSALQPARVDESAARPARPRRRLSLIAIVRQVARFAGARQQSRITF